MNRSKMLRKNIANLGFPYPQNGLVSYWKLDEDPAIHNTSIEDSYGSNNGTLVTNDGSTNKSITGNIGKAINFDGIDDYASIGNVLDFNGQTQSFSVCCWIKTSVGGDNYILGTELNTGFYYRIDRVSDKLLIKIDDGTNDSFARGSVTGLNSNTWRHIVATLDVGAGSFKGYVDGSLDIDITNGSVGDMSDNFNIGLVSLNDFFDGIIDDVLLYNRALTASEIQQIYNYGA